jgi:hypothetical protein
MVSRRLVAATSVSTLPGSWHGVPEETLAAAVREFLATAATDTAGAH